MINDTIPSNRLDNLERYKAGLLKKTKLTKNENDSFIKALGLAG